MALRIGLTGGIGSGKSTVASILQALGARLIDTDAIARILTEPGGEAIDALRASFGPAAIDASGALDRRWMRERAFSNAAIKRQLESLLHPLIAARCDAALNAPGTEPCTVFDVPLLVESIRWKRRVDRVLVVDCPLGVQVERVMRRSGWQREAVERVIAGQASRAARRAAADATLYNGADDLTALQAEVAALWRIWVASPRGASPQQ